MVQLRDVRRQRQGARGQTLSLLPPVGGWNARDALDAMDIQDAREMQDWFPGFGSIRLRNGYSSFVGSGMGTDTVDTLAEFNDGANRKFLAGGNGNIYDITNGTASSLGSGFGDDRWQFVNFQGDMALVNGTDAPQKFDGTTLSNLTISGSGLTVSNLTGVAVYRAHSYFFEKDSQDFWYSAVNALGGTLTKFPLSRVGQFGGKLVAIGTWILGGGVDTWGSGGSIQDVICFFMSSGEVIVYQGDDPGSDFQLIGVYRIGAPLSARGIVKIRDDLIVMTLDGFVPMSQVLRQGRLARNAAISDKIRDAVKEATREFAANTGWEAHVYANGPWALFNIPISSTEFEQYVMNLDTGAWARFTNMNAATWGLFDDNIYFGTTDGKVFQADTGNTDDGSSIGGADGALVRQAYTTFGTTRPKQATAIKPILSGTGDVSAGMAFDADFRERGANLGSVSLAAEVADWQETEVLWENWDKDWEVGNAAAFEEWLATNARGIRLAPVMLVDVADALEWFATDVRLIQGGML